MEFDNLHQILRSLYEQMMPLCADMAGVAKGIAGLGALFYVAYRVNVFHITYGDAVAYAVTHYFIFDFLPAGNTSFHQNLSYSGKTETVFQNFL